MRFLHTSDLHIGKRVNGFSMLEDQREILRQITEIAVGEDCQGMIIAGDIYDRPAPGADAVALFDRFLCDLAEKGITPSLGSAREVVSRMLKYFSSEGLISFSRSEGIKILDKKRLRELTV